MFSRLGNAPRPRFTRLTLYLFLALVIFVLYFWQLGSLTKGLGLAETAAANASSSISVIIDNPTYGPHKLLQYGFQKVFGHGPLQIRLSSVIFSLLFLLCFYVLIKGWFGRLIGVSALLFLAATPWFIQLARHGSPEVLLFSPLAILATYYWLTRSKTWIAWLCLLVAGSLVLYVPGGLLLILLGLIFGRRNLAKTMGGFSPIRKMLGALLVLVLLAPLIYGTFKNPSILKPLLLIPATWPSPLVGLKTAAWDILALFWRTPVHIDQIIERLPIFNAAQVALAVFGSFALYKLARGKLYLLLGLSVFGIVAAALNRNLLLLSYVLPAVAVAVAAGLRYLYMEWKSIFPKNPIPKYLAVALITGLVGMHIAYGLRYSLLAWPNTAATKSTYVLK